jgi:adenylate cyclase class IV
VLTPEQTIEDGQKIAEALMKELGIEAKHLVRRAYVDLLADVPQESPV